MSMVFGQIHEGKKGTSAQYCTTLFLQALKFRCTERWDRKSSSATFKRERNASENVEEMLETHSCKGQEAVTLD